MCKYKPLLLTIFTKNVRIINSQYSGNSFHRNDDYFQHGLFLAITLKYHIYLAEAYPRFLHNKKTYCPFQ
jgi:hypothetical protein